MPPVCPIQALNGFISHLLHLAVTTVVKRRLRL
jgi:hypothetical protein